MGASKGQAMTATNQQDQEQKEDGDENGLDLAGESEVGQGEGTGKRKGDVAPTEAAPPPPPPEPVNGDLGRTNGEMVKSEEDGNDDKKKNDDDDDEGDAREKRIEAIKAQTTVLEESLRELERQRDDILSKIKNKDAIDQTIKNHINLLHAYNSIRDVGTGLMGLIAERRGVRTVEIYREFGVGVTD